MIKTPLLDQQINILKFAKDKTYFGVFASYGSGKSLAALAIAKYKRFKKILIVSTKTSVIATWPDQIKEHTNFKYTTLLGTRKQKLEALYRGLRLSNIEATPYHTSKSFYTVFLINFEGVRSIYHELVYVGFDFLVIDESTKIKNPKADRTKVIWLLGDEVHNKCIMTGFPVTESIGDLYSQIKFLDEGEALGTSYYWFLRQYFVMIGPKRVIRRYSSKKIIKKIKKFCIVISDKDLNLPDKIYKQIKVPMTTQQEKLLYELENYFELELGKIKLELKYIFSLINKSLQVCNGYVSDNDNNLEVIDTNKDKVLMELLDEIDYKKNKIIVWFSFRFSLFKIKRLLKKMHIGCTTIVGGLTDNELMVNYKKFQFGKTNILLATQKKGAESLNLHSCRYAIYYSNTWSYDNRSQSEARIRRKGSEKLFKSVMYIDILTDKSPEVRILKCLKQKKKLVEILLDEFIKKGGKLIS